MEDFECPVHITTEIIGGKWKPLILFHLQEGTRRFGELQRRIPGASKKMLTQKLRELERDEIIRRKVFAEVPPRVEYSLTPYGRTLRPILERMSSWGTRHRALHKNRSAAPAASRDRGDASPRVPSSRAGRFSAA